MNRPTPFRSGNYNAFIKAVIQGFEEAGVTRFVMSRSLFEMRFMNFTGFDMTRDHVQMVRSTLLGKGYKFTCGLDVSIIKLPTVEVPEDQWPLLIETLVKRMQYTAKVSPVQHMRFTHKRFQDYATIWPTADAFREQVVAALRNVGLSVRFLSSGVRVTRETQACTA